MNKSKKRNHLRVVRSEAAPVISVKHENAPSIVIEVTDGMLVTCQVEASVDDCGELLRGILMAQVAILRKMQYA